jgi:adenosine deaminase
VTAGGRIALWFHPEGGAPACLVRDLARRSGTDLSGLFGPGGDWRLPEAMPRLAVCEAIAGATGGPAGAHALIRAALEARAAEGAIHAELRLCPLWHGGPTLGVWRDLVAAVADAVAEAERAAGISARILAGLPRAAGPDSARRAALCAAETAGDLVTGIALFGGDAPGRIADFGWAFDCAREAGLGIVVDAHAPEPLRDVLADPRFTRIAGGAGVARAPALAERLAEAERFVTLDPAADLATGRILRLRDHPAERLRAAGVPLSLSCAMPALLPACMPETCARLAEALCWDDTHLQAIDRAAAAAAFCDPATRTRLTERLESP